MKTVKINRSALVTLLVTLGYALAPTWSKGRLLGKAKSLPQLVDDETEAGDSQPLLDALLADLAAGNEIDITDDSAEETTEAKPKPRGKKAASGSPAKKTEEPAEAAPSREDLGVEELKALAEKVGVTLTKADRSKKAILAKIEAAEKESAKSATKPAKKTTSKKTSGAKPESVGDSAAKDNWGSRLNTEASTINQHVQTMKGAFSPQTIAEALSLEVGRVRGHFYWMRNRNFIVKTDDGNWELKSTNTTPTKKTAGKK
jgi:rRNA maturation endonuclease Nob1